ncbi:hypothetical protein Y886_14060 [Xanthomonas hyacinthi DSM 19077]|nr:hypothetical protein Y886_14060 [Xanthomonas hyacinthi DSM 19077]
MGVRLAARHRMRSSLPVAAATHPLARAPQLRLAQLWQTELPGLAGGERSRRCWHADATGRQSPAASPMRCQRTGSGVRSRRQAGPPRIGAAGNARATGTPTAPG